MVKPTAAPSHFPYMDHRTVAEIEVAQMDVVEMLRISWCDQCQRRVSGTISAKCASRFCSINSSRALAA